MALTTLIIRHRVKEYAAWREEYNSVESLREKYGCIGAEVLTDPADDTDVFVLHRFLSLERAQGFAGSDDLHEAMAHAHVVGAPRIEFALERLS